jgi:hypothetical protein
MSKQAKRLYDTLKEQEALGSGWTGRWNTDKNKFIEQYNADQDIINGLADTLQDDDPDGWP